MATEVDLENEIKKARKNACILLLESIKSETINDITALQGKPFNEETVAELFGSLSAHLIVISTLLIKVIEADGKLSND